jgi:N-acetylmannosamine-6-phosphate 2-epimerase/N-acetylmannosamine kinase
VQLALDIGGTSMVAALVDGAAVLERRAMPTPAAAGPDALADAAAELLAPWSAEARHLCVAATGHVHDGRVTAVNPATLTGWSSYPLAAELARRTRCSVSLMNDAHAAAWGEFRFGAGRNCTDFVFITVSTGIGGGIVLNGELVTGASGLAGHLGFWHDLAGPENNDFLELHASGRAIAERGTRGLGRPVSTREVFSAAAAGEAGAAGIVSDAVRRLARALLNVRWLLDPERIAIGGSVGLSDGYLARLGAELAALAPEVSLEIVPAQLRHDAGLLGAADRLGVAG